MPRAGNLLVGMTITYCVGALVRHSQRKQENQVTDGPSPGVCPILHPFEHMLDPVVFMLGDFLFVTGLSGW